MTTKRRMILATLALLVAIGLMIVVIEFDNQISLMTHINICILLGIDGAIIGWQCGKLIFIK